MNEIIEFNFDDEVVRTVMIEGEPWFVVGDVCGILGIQQASKALLKVPSHQKVGHLIPTLGGTQRMYLVSEAGLYRLIMRSDKKEAEPFIAWVTEEVLPTIRKTGGYSTRQPQIQLPDFTNPAIAARAWADEVEAKLIAHAKITEDAPKVAYADSVGESNGCMSLTETAKSYGLRPQKFIEFLRGTGRIYKRNKENLPIQEYVNNGDYLTVKAIVSCQK